MDSRLARNLIIILIIVMLVVIVLGTVMYMFTDLLKTKDPEYIDNIILKDDLKLLREYLNILSKNERLILEYRYGLNNKDELTQKEIAKMLHISRSYVSRIEKRAITKILREFIKNKNI